MNIKGSTTLDIAQFTTNGASGGSGAIQQTYKSNYRWAGTNNFNGCQLTFDASRSWTGSTSSNGAHTHTISDSSGLLGKSDTVQPNALKLRVKTRFV